MTDKPTFDNNIYALNAILHPGTVFSHVIADATLSRGEKRLS